MMRAWFLLGLLATTAVAASNSVSVKYLDFGDNGKASLLAADSAGNLFAVGTVTEASGRPQLRVIKTDATGAPLASFDFGGSQLDAVAGAAVDAQGNIVIVGSTQSADFPLLNGTNTIGTGSPSGFIVKIDGALQHILFSTLLGGTGNSAASAVAADAKGNIYVAGWTKATDFPTTANAFQSTGAVDSLRRYMNGFVTEISSQGQTVFSTYYTGTISVCLPYPACPLDVGFTLPTSIFLDATGNIVVAGYTDETDLPTTSGAYSQQCNCGQAGFIAKFAPGGSKLVWATLIPPTPGSISALSITGAALESDGSIVAVGFVTDGVSVTSGVGEPTPANAAGNSGFVSRLDATGSKILFSTNLGAGAVIGVAVDAQGSTWVTGFSSSPLPGITTLGPTYTVSLSIDGTHLASGFTAPKDATGQAIVVSAQSGPSSLGLSGSLLLGGSTASPSLLGMANSGGTRVSGSVAALELISLYGVGIGPASPLGAQIKNVGPANQNVITSNLGGVQVLFNGVAAPLLYAGPTQINAVVPFSVANGDVATVQVITPSGTITGPMLRVRPSQPQVFGTFSSQYFATALNQDGTLNSPTNRAANGSVVTVWGTGAGLFNGHFVDGEIVGPGGPMYLTSYNQLSIPYPVSVLKYTLEAKPELQSVAVLYSGAAPNAVQGVIQVNFRVTDEQFQYQLQIGSALSDPFEIYVGGTSFGQ